MAKLERIYTVPLGDAYAASRNNRVPRAIKILKAFVARHMKAEDDQRILISEALNAHIWESSIQRPPRRVKVRLIKDDEAVRAYLADEKIVEKKAEGKKEEKKDVSKPAEAKPAPSAAKPEKSSTPASNARPSAPAVAMKTPSPAAEAKKEK
jgi:large subunit ribosomal protein L31e